MGNLGVFMHLSIDGFFAGPKGEIDWFKTIQKDAAFDAYTHQQAQAGNTLLFGRTTYEVMKSYWPTPDAAKNDPAMAEVMNNSPKIVFSKTLKEPDWKNVTLRHELDRDQIAALKKQSEVTVLGSGSIVQQLANLELVDDYLLVIVPIVLGAGKTLFRDVRQTSMELTDSRSFANGVVVQQYRPR